MAVGLELIERGPFEAGAYMNMMRPKHREDKRRKGEARRLKFKV
jgi:hypothetical protein